jgi:hypothetical protein
MVKQIKEPPAGMAGGSSKKPRYWSLNFDFFRRFGQVIAELAQAFLQVGE